ncbi:hypothetical protein TUM20983_52110 [Mycobacterium antarcticum]|uniref:DUF305 domain-containing protein n=1 Tax=unclassified Mycolicibacterium TaxID=2636767 RepID=UPI0023A01102|nr:MULTISPECIES: DUF305 domain-containing protein [unclassified Mycolicibacterium]GLP78101.1 hypothetical protein TUM20983_52110 [Mycolicibacterium sp. TUM20983]GLP81173.1 hypothetical protein TUM20984_25930 [Mycolicibacterium sp. TUM20984]
MKSVIALVAALATALFLSACTKPAPTAGDGQTDPASTSESSSAAAPNNAADVTFVTGMIPHHEQAVEMSQLAPDRSTDPAVLKLASEIAAAQGPEIETMKAFLVQWNAGTDTGHEGHDMGAMNGMVDDATMSRLETLKGPAFDQLWLQSMIGHHEGAIAMANTEIADGANADAKTLAQQIVTAQQAEITQMKQMLGG